MISIVDYGMGNLGSVINMLKRFNIKPVVTNDKNDILESKKVILPGVGSFDKAINNLKELDLFDILKEFSKKENQFLLGICLGMQLLTNGSDEGTEEGLGLIKAYTHKFNFELSNYKIPHMGWNYVSKTKEHKLVYEFDKSYKFYFVHSYYVKVENAKDSLLQTQYGNKVFDSGISNGNIMGVQFHPEKSHKFGLKLFENFVNL